MDIFKGQSLVYFGGEKFPSPIGSSNVHKAISQKKGSDLFLLLFDELLNFQKVVQLFPLPRKKNEVFSFRKGKG